uniref:serine protease 55-like n=1 Tax=Pristiophorus japonicus TaxID=55135 RepID=UPI00398E63DF
MVASWDAFRAVASFDCETQRVHVGACASLELESHGSGQPICCRISVAATVVWIPKSTVTVDAVCEFYNNTGRKTGLALNSVYSSINETLNLQAKNGQPVPKQIIIIITNGHHHGAQAPFTATKKILNLLSHLPNHLDIYAIGIGEILKDYLERLVPMKEIVSEGQQYAFYLPSYHYLEEAQEIQRDHDDTKFSDCGVRGNLIQRPTPRIFGGTHSKEYDWPWQVVVNLPNKQFCGGSIISKRWILTAAHCVNDTVGTTISLTIWAGSIRRTSTSLQTLHVEEVIIHENFSRPSEMNNDIALLKVKDHIKFSSHVRPVCLPCTQKSAQLLSSTMDNWEEACHYEDGLLTSHGGRKPKFLSGYVSGWGYHKKRSSVPSLNLIHAQVTIQHYSNCASSFQFTENMFCAKGDNADSCRGDSGGPMVMERNHRWIQVGIVSFGRSEICGENITGFYSRVPKLMSWIKEIVTDLEYE